MKAYGGGMVIDSGWGKDVTFQKYVAPASTGLDVRPPLQELMTVG